MGNSRTAKQAVVVIHGIGEQRPMDTLRGFVDALLPASKNGQSNYYSHPDPFSDSLELRRLVSRDSRPRTEFFELYWAHRMPAATWGQLVGWLRVLLIRSPRDVPRTFRLVWLLAWFSVIGIAAIAIYELLSRWDPRHFPPLHQVGTAAETASVPLLLTLFGLAAKSIFTSVAGDAARYLDTAPENIEARRAIRADGVALLDKLHKSGKYDRIIVVGHSLGSVIGYDVLLHAWQAHNEVHDKPDRPSHKALEAVEGLARSDGPLDEPKWREAVRALQIERRSVGCTWLVTDFVTIGSPLAHAPFLLARNQAEFDRKKEQWELPTAPPPCFADRTLAHPRDYTLENGSPRTVRVLHHAAWTACTAWTNLYFPCTALVGGDAIGGPLRPWFGSGIRDVEVRTAVWGGLLAHTHYWQPDDRNRGKKGDPIEALHAALDLRRDG